MEFAPRLAVNPKNADNIAVAWIQGAFNGIVVGFSHDGGDTWGKSWPPMSSQCSGTTDPSVKDPHVSFDPDGRLYLSYCVCVAHEFLPSRVAVHVSGNGGVSWSDPVVLERTTNLHPLDWSWVVADQTRRDTAYAAWTKFDLADEINHFPQDQEMRFARSEDGGQTWSQPVNLSSPPPEADYARFFPRLVALGDGSLVNIFHQIPLCPTDATGSEAFDGCPGQTVSVMAARSTDRGETWSDPVLVASRENFYFFGSGNPDARVTKLENPPVELPAVASDGTIYYTWSSIDSNRSSKLYLTSSSDGGITWATPRVIRESNVPMAAPNVAVAGDRVGVLFYEFRNDDSDDVDVWFISAPSGAQGRFGWERHVAGPFDVLSIQTDEFASVGSSEGVVGTAEGFVSAYKLGQPLSTRGATDIFFSRIFAPGMIP